MGRRGPKWIDIKQKRYDKVILYQNKTWHVVHEQDGISFAVQEIKKGVVGGAIKPFANNKLSLNLKRKDIIFIT